MQLRSSNGLGPCSVVLVALAAGGCTDDPAPPKPPEPPEITVSLLGFVPRASGTGSKHVDGWAAGPQVTKLVISSPVDVVRAELYLDGARIAADEFAPFAMMWDTRDFTEGNHELRARIELIDGSHAEGKATVAIDNTPPRVNEAVLAKYTVIGMPYFVSADDNGAIDRIAVTHLETSDGPIEVTGASGTFTWQWSCPAKIEVRAFDLAGNSAPVTATVNGLALPDCSPLP